MRAPLSGPIMKGFVDQLVEVNLIAEASPGFVWRLKSEEGDATNIRAYEDELILVNMSVWESLESLRNYVYRSDHMRVLRNRAKWFDKMDKPHYCLWWVPVGQIPLVAEGRERVEHYQRHGSTQYSFWFSQHFPAPTGETVSV